MLLSWQVLSHSASIPLFEEGLVWNRLRLCLVEQLVTTRYVYHCVAIVVEAILVINIVLMKEPCYCLGLNSVLPHHILTNCFLRWEDLFCNYKCGLIVCLILEELLLATACPTLWWFGCVQDAIAEHHLLLVCVHALSNMVRLL